MPSSFQLPESLLYTPPVQTTDGDVNWVSFPPMSGSSFGPSESFKINVSTPNELLIPQRSYLKFNLRLTGGATTTSGSSLSSLGGASVFQSITTELGGVQVESLQNYNAMLATQYKRLPNTNQILLGETEMFGKQTELTKSANAYLYGRDVCHPLHIAILESSDNALPLFAVRGGLQLSFQLETLNNVLASAASASTSYVVSSIEFVGCMLKPSDDYLQSFIAGMSKGSVAHIPLQLTKNIRVSPGTTDSQRSQLHTGFLRSIRSITGVCRVAASLNNPAVDANNSFTSNNLKQYYFEIGSTRYPRNKVIKATNSTSFAAPSPENIMMAICSLDNTFPHFNQTDITQNTDQMVYYNWASNRGFGSGISSEDGIITFNHDYNNVGTVGSETMDFWLNYDADLRIGAAGVALDNRSF